MANEIKLRDWLVPCLKRLARQHEQFIDWAADSLDLSHYHMLWVAFFKGLIIGVILCWTLF